MDSNYFKNVKGYGVLSTADKDGKVNSAVFSRPHGLDDGTFGFIMPERLSWANLQMNPHASFLFHEQGDGWKGVRLQLTKVKVEDDPIVINSMRRRTYSEEDERKMSPLHLVCFEVAKELPLIGAGPAA